MRANASERTSGFVKPIFFSEYRRQSSSATGNFDRQQHGWGGPKLLILQCINIYVNCRLRPSAIAV